MFHFGLLSVTISESPELETLTKGKYTNKMIGNTAFMLLNKPIGQSTPTEIAISGPEFADELYFNKSQGKDVTVKINCLGGRVGMGWDMVDSIIETKSNTENIGFAYSMGGICLIVGNYRTAYPHSRAMIHAPRREDGKKDYHTELLKDQFRAILKNHTKFTDEEVNDMIDSGKDYFFNAEEMKTKGMIDAIMPTGNGRAMATYTNDFEAYQYYNSLEQNNQSEDMEWINKFFGGKTEGESMVNAAQMKAEYDNLKTVKAQLEADLATAKAENITLKAEKETITARSKGADLIDSAIKTGKFKGMDEATKAKWVENATANYDTVKSMIDALPTGKHVAAATIPGSENKGGGELTYEWLMKNNPNELARIAEQDEALFNKLSEEWVAKQKETQK